MRFSQLGRFSTHCRYTDVYVRRGDAWVAVSAEATTIPELR